MTSWPNSVIFNVDRRLAIASDADQARNIGDKGVNMLEKAGLSSCPSFWIALNTAWIPILLSLLAIALYREYFHLVVHCCGRTRQV